MKIAYPILLIAAFLLVACGPKDPPVIPAPPPNEEELITTVILTFVDVDTNALGEQDIYYMEFRDVDGVGGNEPEITADSLPAFRSFALSVVLRNESVSPAEELTEQILNEGNEHQLFFLSNSSLSITYNDQDQNGMPIGLVNAASTGAASEGSLTVVVRHGPDKDAEGVAQGEITNAGGETDVEASFPIVIF